MARQPCSTPITVRRSRLALDPVGRPQPGCDRSHSGGGVRQPGLLWSRAPGANRRIPGLWLPKGDCGVRLTMPARGLPARPSGAKSGAPTLDLLNPQPCSGCRAACTSKPTTNGKTATAATSVRSPWRCSTHRTERPAAQDDHPEDHKLLSLAALIIFDPSHAAGPRAAGRVDTLAVTGAAPRRTRRLPS
jgi:hypothetical protein